MTLDGINRWLSLGASLGVVVGLILLVVELEQNRQFARTQFLMDGDASFQDIETAMLGETPSEVWAKSILEPESLSPAELKVLDSWLIHRLSRWARTWELETQGFLSEGETERMVRRSAPFIFGNRSAKVWWSREMNTWDAEFTELIDSIIKEIDDSRNQEWIESFQRDLRESVSAQ